jgi:hypothetical protein
MTLVRDRWLYVVGGYTTCSPELNEVAASHLADVHVFDLETGEWRSPTLRFSPLQPRSLHAAVLVPASVPASGADDDPSDLLWILGGHNHAHTALGGVDLLCQLRLPRMRRVRRRWDAPVQPPTASAALPSWAAEA